MSLQAALQPIAVEQATSMAAFVFRCEVEDAPDQRAEELRRRLRSAHEHPALAERLAMTRSAR